MPTKKDCIAAEFYHPYINLVKEENVVKAIKKSGAQLKKFLKTIPRKKRLIPCV